MRPPLSRTREQDARASFAPLLWILVAVGALALAAFVGGEQ